MSKFFKYVFAVLFWPIAIFLVAKSIRGRILGGVSTLFYAYAVYHLTDRFFDDTAKTVHFVFFYEGWAEVAGAALLVFLLVSAKKGGRTSRETTGLGERGRHIRGRIFKPVRKFGGLKSGSLTFGQHKIDPAILKTHAIVAGTTGSGKTQTLYPVIKHIVDNGLKAVITDPKVEFAARFMKKGDIVLSPFFKESAAWTPFCEIEDYSDCVSVSHFLIPTESGETETWNAYARDMLSDIFYCLTQENCKSTAAVLSYLKSPTLAQPLFEKYQRTSAGLFEKGAEKLLQNVRFVCAQIAKSLEILPDEGSFSIKEWAKDPKGGILWLPYSVKQREAISRLLPLWVSLGITGSMLPERVNANVQTFFILDELDSVGNVDKLPVLITEGRGYGLSAVLGFQNVGQILKRYGAEANSILSVVNNFLLLKQGGGADSAGNVSDSKFWSEFIGNEEVERLQKSESKKGITYNGSSESHHIESVRIATPEQLQALETRTGFAIFSGDIDTKSADGIVRDFRVGVSAFPVKTKLTEKKVDPLLPNAPDIEVESEEDPAEHEDKTEEQNIVKNVQTIPDKEIKPEQDKEDKYAAMAVSHGWLSGQKQEEEDSAEETDETDKEDRYAKIAAAHGYKTETNDYSNEETTEESVETNNEEENRETETTDSKPAKKPAYIGRRRKS